jgi:hypothetical protein
MKLLPIILSILIENNEEGSGALETDPKMTEKTLDDVFTLNDTGLAYVQQQLAKINKKATRIGVKPLELKIIKEGSYKSTSNRDKREVVVKTYDVKVEGKPPIIDGYEFIASIEHSEAGNIINISPAANVKELPAEYRTSNTDCDYCHTKRDRLNTFVLRETATGKFKKVGRSCLKNFLPSQNPASILGYAEMLSKVLGALIGGEEADPDADFGGGGHSKYYDADTFLTYVCAAYVLNGERYTSGKVAREHEGLVSTANFAMNLMNMNWASDDFKKEYRDKLNNAMSKAEALAKEVETWKDTKDWDVEIEKKPDMATYFHNMKVISNSSAIQYKNAGYHASLLAVYLREKAWKEKQAVNVEKAKTKTYLGKVGEKISFTAILKKYTSWQSQWGWTHLYVFNEVGTENEVVYYASRDLNLEEGKTYKVVAAVKAHQVSKFNQAPQTVITRGKATLVGGGEAAPAETEPTMRDQWGNALDAHGNKIPNSKPTEKIVPHDQQDAWKQYTK